jgi:hypothetical protein
VIERFIIIDHLNKIQAGRQTNLSFPGREELNRNPAEFMAKKTAVILICVGLGLSKFVEIS